MRCVDILSFLLVSLLLTSSQARVPAAILKRIRQLSTEEFIDEFLRMPQTDPLANNGSSCGVGAQGQECSSAGRIPPDTRESMLIDIHQPDLCSPHLMTVEVPLDPDPNVVRFPTCVLLERCAGCTGVDQEVCARVDYTYVPKRVLVSRFTATGSNHFDYSDIKTIFMEKHLSCERRCKVQPNDCNYNVHSKHDEDLCRCICKNAHQESACSSPKRWDDEACECICPFVTNCDSRFYAFNTDTCSCERRSLSSASSLGIHSSANDPTGDTETRGLDEAAVERLRGMVQGEGAEGEATLTPTTTTTTTQTTTTTETTMTTTTTPPTTEPEDPCANKQCQPFWEPAPLANGGCGCSPTFDIFAGFPVRKRK